MPDRLNLTTDLLPVQAFFNAISDRDFVEVISGFANGIGRSINDSHCEFPNDLDPWEPSFEGVRFSLFEEEKILSARDFISILRDVCYIQSIRHSEQSSPLKALIREVEIRMLSS